MNGGLEDRRTERQKIYYVKDIKYRVAEDQKYKRNIRI
jgi:hypothetical protein